MRSTYVIGAALAVAFFGMDVAHARNLDFLLRGTFSGTSMNTCLQSIGGFNPDLTPNNFSFVTTTNTFFTIVFDGDGHASFQGQEVSVTAPPAASASSDTVQFNSTYHVNPDRTVTSALDGPVTGQIATGTLAGQSFTVDQLAPSSARLSEDGRSLTSGTTDTFIETITFSGGLVLQRICARTAVDVKVERDTDQDIAGQR